MVLGLNWTEFKLIAYLWIDDAVDNMMGPICYGIYYLGTSSLIIFNFELLASNYGESLSFYT